ncbi:hypothetical protein CPB85DRAFT_1268962 [Mucidula mucida]|nr:hypothetical protein CPB85DRAFT_1268962 [Mucidula mucida]
MRFSFAVAATILSAAFVSAEDHLVVVGDGGLVFNPTTVTAAKDDTITFSFRPKNHTVTQSTFADPCTRMTTPKEGIDSGFAPVAADATSLPQWTITIDDPSTPLWFFCAQTQHCQMGMVFAVNPTADKTFEAFQATAMGGAAGSSNSTASGSAGASGSSATATGATGGSTGGAANGGSTNTATGASVSAATNTAGAAGTGTGTASGAAASSTDNGAMSLSGGQTSLLAIAGLMMGLML